jgi:hypothetical protein
MELLSPNLMNSLKNNSEVKKGLSLEELIASWQLKYPSVLREKYIVKVDRKPYKKQCQ